MFLCLLPAHLSKSGQHCIRKQLQRATRCLKCVKKGAKRTTMCKNKMRLSISGNIPDHLWACERPVPAAGCSRCPGASPELGQDPSSRKSEGRWPTLPQKLIGCPERGGRDSSECSAGKSWCWWMKTKSRHVVSEQIYAEWMLFSVCPPTHPLSFSLRLPKQEVSSSALKSFDRKSKLPRTSSTARVSSDDELLSKERSFWKGKEKHYARFPPGVWKCLSANTHRYLQDGCQVQYLMVQRSQLLVRATLALECFFQLCDHRSQSEGLGPALGTAHRWPRRGRGSFRRRGWRGSWSASRRCGWGCSRVCLSVWGVLDVMWEKSWSLVRQRDDETSFNQMWQRETKEREAGRSKTLN